MLHTNVDSLLSNVITHFYVHRLDIALESNRTDDGDTKMKKEKLYSIVVSTHNSSMFIELQVDTYFCLKASTSFQRYC